MYEKVDNELRVTKEVVETHTLDALYERKTQIESILKRELDKYQAELDLYQPQLDEVEAMIAEAKKLKVPFEKEEAIKAAALEVAEPIEEVTIKG